MKNTSGEDPAAGISKGSIAGYQNHWTETDKPELGIEKHQVSRHNHVNHAKSTTSLASLQVVIKTGFCLFLFTFFC